MKKLLFLFFLTPFFTLADEIENYSTFSEEVFNFLKKYFPEKNKRYTGRFDRY